MIGKNEKTVSLGGVSKIYKVNEHLTAGVKDITFSAAKGELVLLLGPSGSGKTTLLSLIAGLIEPSEGKVILFRREVNSYSKTELQKLRAEKIGFIFQTFLLIDSLTALENVKLLLKFAGKTSKESETKAVELLNYFNISCISGKFPNALSQGEKQRVAVARAVANDADLILADEPTASLEVKQGFEIIEMLNNYAKEKNKSVIVASHDLRLKDYADKIIYMEDGRITQEESIDENIEDRS
ncbi:MAG TPA: ABC transporter ATP-binding protein [Ignavibacteriaceae bacterium]|nr:ABC transporter ATP-binding protein [Ignavibacteriaceae bacterium]